MTRTDELNGLVEASKLLEAKAQELCREPYPIYAIVAHARHAVNVRLAAMLRGE